MRLRPEIFGALLEAAYPDVAHARKREEVLLALAFVSMGCVLRRFLGLPHIDGGAILLEEVKKALPR